MKRSSLVFLIAIFFCITSVITQTAHADRQKLRFVNLVTGDIAFSNGEYLQFTHQNGTAMDNIGLDPDGNLEINTGTVAGEFIQLLERGNLMASFGNNDIDFYEQVSVTGNVTLTTGNFLIASDTYGIYRTNDTDELVVGGGFGQNASDGAFLILEGDDNGGTDAGGGARLNVGNNASANFDIIHDATTVATFDSDELFLPSGSMLRFGDSDAKIRTDGDAKRLQLCGGGGASVANGACMFIDGDDSGGADSGDGIFIELGDNASSVFELSHNSSTVATFDSAATTLAGRLDFSADPARIQRADKTGSLDISGGFGINPADGAVLSLYGDDDGGAESGAGADLNMGDNAGATFDIIHNATTVATFDSGGLVMGVNGTAGTPQIRINDDDTGFYKATTNAIGVSSGGSQIAQFDATNGLTGTINSWNWSGQNSANTACTTQCTSSALFGLDDATGNFVGPSDATADHCVCAGGS